MVPRSLLEYREGNRVLACDSCKILSGVLDLLENVLSARALGMQAFQFFDAPSLTRELEAEGLL